MGEAGERVAMGSAETRRAPAGQSPRVGRTGAGSADRVAGWYARVALAAAFLSAVASRFGLWTGAPARPAFGRFLAYTAEVNGFLPAGAIPFLAWAATALELGLGLGLLCGLRARWVGLGAALLLALFGTAMAVSLGLKSPLDYSVFSASAAALLLARAEPAAAPRTNA